jgi:ABC-type thiamin/hydroxymethylpyrimidine transport system permease subunit
MAMSQPGSDQPLTPRQREKQSLDVVQRAVISALIGVVFGLFAAVLAAYLVVYGSLDLAPGDVIGLWVMTGVVGLLTAAAILVVNRRRPYSPWVILGLLPMAISGFWIFD